jgi:8-oxo-dGTP pyrophosphatase MutT (NUDIX family)
MKRLKKSRGNGRSSRPIQYGALPYREIKSGVQILLVTSRGTRRWIIPKGWPQSGTPPHRAAAQEAFEEAGVVGKVGKKTIGSYWYDKIFESGATVRCKVRVFPLRVTRQFKRWPEKRQRRTQWHSPAQASRRVRETYLRQIIRTFVKHRNVRAAASNFATTGARWLIALG